MTPDAIRASHRRVMDAQGERVIIRSGPIANYQGALPEGPTRARILTYSPEEIAAGITAANRKAILLHEDLAATPFPTGPVKGMRLIWNGRTLIIANVDNGTRRLQGVPIAYICEVSGA